ncbi:MAG: DpnD/PcfM family protein [Phycisphaerae bacterium]
MLSKVVEVKVSSVEEAIDKVKEMYRTEEIVLDWKNNVGTEIDEYEE